MKRKHFFTLTACIAWAFSAVMLTGPMVFLETAMVAPDASDALLMQLLGGNLFAFGCLNFMVRDEKWSGVEQYEPFVSPISSCTD